MAVKLKMGGGLTLPCRIKLAEPIEFGTPNYASDSDIKSDADVAELVGLLRDNGLFDGDNIDLIGGLVTVEDSNGSWSKTSTYEPLTWSMGLYGYWIWHESEVHAEIGSMKAD